MIWPAEAVQAQYSDVEVDINEAGSDRAKIDALLVGVKGEEEVKGVLNPGYDVIVFQRPMNRLLVGMIPFLQAEGVKVVVEIDDDFDALSPNNVAWQHAQSQHSPERNKLYLRQACAAADLVVCTTDALARRYGSHGRVAVIPNYAREKYLKIEGAPNERPTIGWSGSVLTHPHDLQQTRGAVWTVMSKRGADLRVVGTGKGVHKKLNIPESVEVESTGWLDIEDDYPQAMASIDVGVVPLELSAFNQAKSWLKGLEFASLGVPFVASPTDPYQKLYYRGIGFLAEARNKNWTWALTSLLNDPQGYGATFRSIIDITDMTIERRAYEWYNAWKGLA